MEKRRPATAPPGPRNNPPDPVPERASSNRLLRSRLYKSQTPDSIEEAAASLFTRVRALIASQQQGKSRDSSPSNGAATSSYYGDDESPTSDRREWGMRAHSTSSSSGVVAFKSVLHRSVPESTFTNDLPMPPSYLHSSQPVDLGEEASSERKVDRVSTASDAPNAPSATAFGRRLRDDLEDSSGDDADEDAQVTDGGIDPEGVRRKVLDRPPSAPIPTTDPIVAVLYDSSSSTRRSLRQTPDLFPRKVALKDYRKAAATPANTIATPQPLLNVIPATPSLLSSSGGGGVVDDDPSVLIAHTGATTPEEGSIQNAQDVEELISAIEGRGKIPDFGFENPSFRNLDSSPDVPGTITPQSCPSISVGKRSTGAFALEGGQEDLVCSSYPKNEASVLPYTGIGNGSGPPNSLDKGSQSLHQAFVNSDPQRMSRRGRGPPKDETQASVPMSTSSFQRIIHDLEEMLNQALDLASRAVADSHTALNQRDASRGGSARASIATEATSTGDYGAASFKTANELEQDGEGTFSAVDESLEKLQDASVSTTAVYRDDGEPTSSSGAGVTRVRRSYSETEFESLRVTAPAAVVNPRGYVELTRSARKAYRKPRDAERRSDQSRYQRQKAELQAVNPRIPVQLRDITATDRGRHVQIEEPARGNGYTGGWDWSLRGKRVAAIMACSVSGLISFIVGCYFGESAAMWRSLRISGHVASLGNVSFLIGVALPVLVLWPLPLLHGKKPYLLLSIALVVPLQLPQALSLPPHTTVQQHLDDSMLPYVICMMVFRGVSGIVLGFAAMIAFATIMDLFGPDTGACCRGGIVFNNRARIDGVNQYHMVSGGEAGSRIGVWLGIWAWLFVSFPGVGFFIGQIIADKASPAWGFWTVAMADGVLFFAVAMIPEVRPPWRRVVGERRRGGWMRRRVERGELALVVFGRPPEWWWEEVWAGLRMSGRMCGQVGFALLAAYSGWVVGEVTMVMRLLSFLISNHYKFVPVDLGLAILAMPIAALLSIPFQLSALYLRNFRHRAHLPAYAGETHARMGRHHYRSSLYLSTILLPLSGLGFTMSATGPPTHFMLPVAFAAVACFSGTLAVAECHILLWDNWDVSDLPEIRLGNSGSVSSGASEGGRPHGTSRPAMLQDTGDAGFMTAHPAISAGMAIFHSLALLTAALAFGTAGRIEETIGVRNGVAIWVGIGFLLALCLGVVLWRGRGQRMLLAGSDQDGRVERWFLVGALQKGQWTRWSEAGELRWGDDLVD